MKVVKCIEGVLSYSAQRKSIAAVGEFEKPPPTTEAQQSFEVEVKNKSRIANVQPELKYKKDVLPIV